MSTVDTWRDTHAAWSTGGEDAWLNKRRQDALARFEATGFPTRKTEAWRYTSLRDIKETAFQHGPADAEVSAAVDAVRLEEAAAELVLVNGMVRPDLCRLPERGDVRVGNLGMAMAHEPETVSAVLGGVVSDDEAFTALNDAFLQDGLALHLPHGTDAGLVHLISVTASTDGPVVAHPRHLLLAEDHAKAVIAQTYVELGDAPVLSNEVFEVKLGAGADVTVAVLGPRNTQARRVVTMAADVGRDARFTHHATWLGGPMVRNNVAVTLSGPGAEVKLDGVYVLGDDDHVDNNTLLDHAAPHGVSRERYKGVLGGRATGVFDGLILVREGAQKTDASQSNRNLLLSDTADANAKPRLEIYADDVKCAHGTTVGQLDKEQLWYLRSRGISEEDSVRMLTEAFVADVVDGLSVPVLRERAAAAVTERLTAVWEASR